MRPAVALCLMGLMMLAGCVTQEAQRTQGTVGQEQLGEALAQLQAQADKVVPLQVWGKCRLGYPDQEGVLKESPSVNIKLWLDPPDHVYMQGFAGMGASGKIEMGSNPEIFWVGVKLDVDEFWWGRWDKTHNQEDLQVSPKAVLAALGVLDLGDRASWAMNRQEERIVLTQRGTQQQMMRQIFLDSSSYLPQRILYFDDLGKATLVVELARYTSLANGFKVPQDMAISTFQGDECVHYMKLNVTQVRKRTFSESKRQAIFKFDESKLAGYGKVTEVTE